VPGESDAPGVVAGRQVWSERNRRGIGLLCAGPVAAVIQDVAAEALAIHEVLAVADHCVGPVWVAGGLLERCNLAAASRRGQ